MSDALNLVLFSGTADKLHAAATLAAGAAAMDRPVNVLLQYWALDAFRTDRIEESHGLACDSIADGAEPAGERARRRSRGSRPSGWPRSSATVSHPRLLGLARRARHRRHDPRPARRLVGRHRRRSSWPPRTARSSSSSATRQGATHGRHREARLHGHPRARRDPELATIPFVMAAAALASDVAVVMGFQADGVELMQGRRRRDRRRRRSSRRSPSSSPTSASSAGLLLVCSPCLKSRGIAARTTSSRAPRSSPPAASSPRSPRPPTPSSTRRAPP